MTAPEIDHRINSSHGERPEDIEEAMCHESASRLRLQRILSEIWTIADDSTQDALDCVDKIYALLNKEFPAV